MAQMQYINATHLSAWSARNLIPPRILLGGEEEKMEKEKEEKEEKEKPPPSQWEEEWAWLGSC
ncbi:MAG TPA: hypothetical protein VJB65_00195 [Patescibacteria group bacterium]|nr:hypothetical protein [Patescibacteria group bacterium]